LPPELNGLPPPVQRYLAVALPQGARPIRSVTLEHTGTFNLSEDGERWRPFTSTQRTTLAPPGFDWHARIRLLPGLSIRVRDAFIGGQGILEARLLGLPLANLRGTAELARGELMRFLAEAAWYPTALLPGPNLQWSPRDDTSARAELTAAGVSASLVFRFGADGLVETVRAEDRGRTMRGQVIPTPWEGRWSDYVDRDGMRVPLRGEVAWMLPGRRLCYWRGFVQRLEYDHG
jgi:hypothetical protein